MAAAYLPDYFVTKRETSTILDKFLAWLDGDLVRQIIPGDNDNDNDHRDINISKEEEKKVSTSNMGKKKKEKEQSNRSNENCEAMLKNWEVKFKKLHEEWLTRMNDSVIETKKELHEAKNAYQEDRRKWEEEKVQLVAKLSAATASAELYRELLHSAFLHHQED
ncbi:hypothetical protein RIF29_30757 [Crotalaria pallida]|uniref:Uncharacterized protein n=1 Tax=Crotalaria pallida TaxID=3830 RepID=A0AAN9EIM3_CROPI